MNILITCAGRRNYLINYFKDSLGDNGKVIAIDMTLSASALAEADVVYQVPSINNENYLNSLRNIIEKEKVDAVISLNDMELPILARNKTCLEETGTKVLVSNEKVVETCFDKWKSYHFFKELGLDTPKTFLTFEDSINAINNLEITFPLIVKPRWGSASVGINRVENERELGLIIAYLKISLEKGSNHKPHTPFDVENSIIIQEMINGQEYGIDILNDFNGKYHSSFVRKKLGMRYGETDRAISVINEKFSEMARNIGNSIGHIGNMDCDFFVQDEKVFFIEMNPRFGGGYPFSHNAGVNIPGIYIEWLKGKNDVEKFNQYRENLGFAKFDQIIQFGSYYNKNKSI
ncbi:ATP-grasp domain-containing protein [Flagellimonas sp. 2504JD1-5]